MVVFSISWSKIGIIGCEKQKSKRQLGLASFGPAFQKQASICRTVKIAVTRREEVRKHNAIDSEKRISHIWQYL